MPTVYAIVPARGGSRGIPRKNLKKIDGDHLVGIAAKQAEASKHINRTIVNSDDKEIREVATSYDVDTMNRPERFAHEDNIREVDRLLKWSVEQLESRGNDIDIVVLLYPTAPLRTIETIDEGIKKVIEGPHDSLLSLYEDHNYLWKRNDKIVEPTNYDPMERGPRQMEDWNQWVENKALYVMERDLLIKTGCRLGDDVGFVEMPEWRSIDIDTPTELELARFFSKNPPS